MAAGHGRSKFGDRGLIPLAHFTAWRQIVSWADDAQVEQDLILSRAAVESFTDSLLAEQVVLRGGTALHKLILDPAYRYSEDIDLVQSNTVPISATFDALRIKVDIWLG